MAKFDKNGYRPRRIDAIEPSEIETTDCELSAVEIPRSTRENQFFEKEPTSIQRQQFVPSISLLTVEQERKRQV
jgi:hypothetical protein